MVMTILEAHVYRRQWETLEKAYCRETQNPDPGIDRTYLIHSPAEEDLWQIVTIWKSQEALDAMRNSGETPRGVSMFQLAGAQPSLRVQNIVTTNGGC